MSIPYFVLVFEITLFKRVVIIYDRALKWGGMEFEFAIVEDGACFEFEQFSGFGVTQLTQYFLAFYGSMVATLICSHIYYCQLELLLKPGMALWH